MAEAAANLADTLVNATVGGSVGGSGFESMGKPADPFWMEMLSAMPSTKVSMAATALRGSNTIIGKGWGERALHRGSRFGANVGGDIRKSARNNNPFRPRNWARFGSQEIFDEAKDSKAYTPFQFLSKGANWVGDKTGLTERLFGEAGGDLLSKGGWSRMTAGARVGNMGSRRFARTMGEKGGSRAFLEAAGYDVGAIKDMTQGTARQALSLTGTGQVNSAVTGFIEGTRGGFGKEVVSHLDDIINTQGPGGDVVKKRLAAQTARKFEGIGMEWGAQAAERAGIKLGAEGLEKIGLRMGGKLLMKGGMKGAGIVAARTASWAATRAIPYIGWAMLAYDVAKFTTLAAGAAVKGSLKLANEGMKSMRGGMNYGVMEQGFKDNSASMSSRSRGVMAIQNSRLNARSVLGNEGAAMHAHFG